MKKCIISDFDGTFYDLNFEENISKIKEFVRKGNIFVLATGRTFNSIKEAIKGYDIPYEYLITSDGASIYDKEDRLIYEKIMDKKLVYSIIDFILKKHFSIYIKFDNNICVTDKAVHVSRILIKGNIDDKKELCELINKKFSEDIYAYISENWLDITYKSYNKLSAIMYLQLNNKITNIYTIGNDENDYSMIDYYNGYLVGNSENYKSVKSFDEFIEKINHIV